MVDYFNYSLVSHGGNVHQAARRWGVRPEEVIDFSANINPLGPPSQVINAPTSKPDFQWYP
ncbi:hypothetical protein L0152_04600, partial [bacterium]|nr:hypothetical protein [bacterium]